MHYLDFLPTADHDRVLHIHSEKQEWISQPKKGFLRYREPCELVGHLRASTCDFSGDTVVIGRPEDQTLAQSSAFLQRIQGRGGPQRSGTAATEEHRSGDDAEEGEGQKPSPDTFSQFLTWHSYCLLLQTEM